MKRFAARELGPGWGEAIRFDSPSGHLVELVHGMERVGNMLPMTNPPPKPVRKPAVVQSVGRAAATVSTVLARSQE